MIRFCINYGDNVTDGAQIFSALRDAMRSTTEEQIKPDAYSIKNDSDSKQLIIEFGAKCEEPHQNVTIKVSIRDDYELEESKTNEDDPAQLELPFDETANEKIEKILDADGPSGTTEPSETEVPVETPSDQITNGCVDEDGDPEIEVASDTNIATEEVKPEA